MVIDDLMHAVTAKYPYTRYVPGRYMQMASDMFVVQANIITDHFVKTRVGVKCVPFSMRERKTV